MKLAFISLIILIIVLCGYFFMPQGNDELEIEISNIKQDIAVVEAKSASDKSSADESESEDLSYQQKVDTYQQLEKSRRNLDRVVARIKALSWKKNLPREKAEAINKELLNAHGLLKNKKLLGAFKDLEAIQDELNKVQYSHGQISDYVKYIKSLKDTK